MRPYYLLLLTLAFVLFAYPSAVLADASSTVDTLDALSNKEGGKRFLRSHEAADTVDVTDGEDSEDRGMLSNVRTKLTLEKMRFKDVMKTSMKEWKEAQKVKSALKKERKEDDMLNKLLSDRVPPSEVFTGLKLDKLVDKMDEAAKRQPLYKFFKRYERIYADRYFPAP